MLSIIGSTLTDPISVVLLMFTAFALWLTFAEVKHSFHQKGRQARSSALYKKEHDAWSHASGKADFSHEDSVMDGVEFYEGMADLIEKDPKFVEFFPNYGGYDAYPGLEEPTPANCRVDDFFDRVTEYAAGVDNETFGEDAPTKSSCEITIVDEPVENLVAVNSFSQTLHMEGFHQKVMELLNEEPHVDAEIDGEAGV